MRTAFTLKCQFFDPTEPTAFRIEQTVMNSTWDWYPLRVALVLGAIWHAKMQSRARRHRPTKREVYAAVADALCAMLHRLGDVEHYIDDDGQPAQRERHPCWTMQSGLNQVVRDIETWVDTDVPRYRVASWAPQWEALRSACTALEGFGQDEDAALFTAVLDLEALEKVQSEHNPGRRHAAVLALCGKAAEWFSSFTHTPFMVEPIRQLVTILQAGDGSYELCYLLTEVEGA